ncbi:MAG: hypothetical protein AAFV53_23475 [Myxococcota bacterium]
MQAFDPFRLHSTHRPVPVEGPTHPPVRLVEDDDLELRRSPLWLRIAAAAMAIAFFVNLLLTAAISAGQFSPLTDAGDLQKFNQQLP